jgi:Tfp pilus assembly protein PilF
VNRDIGQRLRLHRLTPLVAACVLGAISTWTGCASEEKLKKADGYYQEGLAHLNNDRQRAFVSFQRAIQENPSHKDAHYSLGHIYAQLRKFQQAEDEFRQVLKIDSDYSEAHAYLGVMMASQDRWQEAIKEYHAALSNPLYATPDVAWFNLGVALAHEGDMEGAATALEDALLVSPPSVPPALVNYELGQAYYRLGYNVKAREAMTRVTSLDKGGQYASDAEKWLERLKP